MSVNPVFPVTFNGGQMTDLPVFSGTLDGTELFEVVAPGNVANGVNYSITSTQLAALLPFLAAAPVIISNGQYTNPAAPYPVPAGVSRVYVNKTSAEPTYVLLATASAYAVEPLVREIAGTNGNTITVSFTGGQQADGNATVPIVGAYSGYFFRPVSAANKWTLGVG